ncbi:hypothetical protein DFH29DRAFT_242875 [Suillus ampliporus]|nr:hypothetical protein DFH29DRAFT_242875 [Suillus ampliporus]
MPLLFMFHSFVPFPIVSSVAPSTLSNGLCMSPHPLIASPLPNKSRCHNRLYSIQTRKRIQQGTPNVIHILLTNNDRKIFSGLSIECLS